MWLALTRQDWLGAEVWLDTFDDTSMVVTSAAVIMSSPSALASPPRPVRRKRKKKPTYAHWTKTRNSVRDKPTP